MPANCLKAFALFAVRNLEFVLNYSRCFAVSVAAIKPPSVKARPTRLFRPDAIMLTHLHGAAAARALRSSFTHNDMAHLTLLHREVANLIAELTAQHGRACDLSWIETGERDFCQRIVVLLSRQTVACANDRLSKGIIGLH